MEISAVLLVNVGLVSNLNLSCNGRVMRTVTSFFFHLFIHIQGIFLFSRFQ